MPDSTARPLRLFVSFAPEDHALKDELLKHLAVLKVETWSADRVRAGGEWRREVEEALERADVALLLMSADFLASDFLQDSEVPQIFSRRTNGGLHVIPVLLRSCLWTSHMWLGKLRPLPLSGKAIAAHEGNELDRVLTEIATEVDSLLGSERKRPPRQLEFGLSEPYQGVMTTLVRGTAKIPDADVITASRIPVTLVESEFVAFTAVGLTSETAREVDAIQALTPRPTPEYPDDETRVLSQKLAAAQLRKQRLQEHGMETSEVIQEILGIKRHLREGGQLKPGDSLGDGRYLLLDVLGRGGFATVWRALDEISNETIAVKVLHSNLAGDRVRLDRFKRGARIMGELQHEAVVRVLEPYGEDGGWHYFVMEYLQGGDLQRAVMDKRIDVDQAMPLIIRIGEALATAHTKGIVHRDVKPANILLEISGLSKLADFDLVGAADTTGGTRTGALGSFLYASPESMHSPQDVDPRADVYSLGITAIFCLYGKPLPVSFMRQSSSIINSLQCHSAIKSILAQATEWEPQDRFADAGRFCEALRAAIKDASGHNGRPHGHALVTRRNGPTVFRLNGSFHPQSFPDYSQEAPLVRAAKKNRAGLSTGGLERLLSWLERTWSTEEESIRAELKPDAGGFDDWIAALAQTWTVAQRIGVESSDAGNYTRLSYLGKLIDASLYPPESLALPLWVAWLWARGRTAKTSDRFLGSERGITGYTGQGLKNILVAAEPVSHVFQPKFPELWGVRFGLHTT